MYANKGKSLERTIGELFKHYRTKKIFCMRIHEPRTNTGIIYDKSPFDFIVFHNGTLYGFDAKECAGDSINIKTNLKYHQIDAMSIVHHNKGDGFFLIWFSKHKKLCKVGVEQVQETIYRNEKSIHVDDCKQTKLDFLGVL